jgi:hypothetical protein
MTIQRKIKGVSDLEKYIDCFSLPGKSHENFPDYIILKNNTSICQNFFLEIWDTFTTGSQLILTGSHDARTVSLGQWLFAMQWGSEQFRWSCNYCTKIRLDKFFVYILRRSHKFEKKSHVVLKSGDFFKICGILQISELYSPHIYMESF